MCADDDYSVAIRKSLPEEPKIFALIHEFKHHLRDQDLLKEGVLVCGDWNENEMIEKGAEVFAAEFIWPEQEFAEYVQKSEIEKWQADDLVHLKKRSPAKISYTFLQKRLHRMGLIERNQFRGVQFKKREEELYGLPIYKQPWFRHRRAVSS